jgi:shikimate dehydrogenase
MDQLRSFDNTGLIRLGLIGGNIAASRSPELHRLCGLATGLDVSYELLVPSELGQDFETVFATCRDSMRGVNITYPYKQRVRGLVEVPDPAVARIGSINTVVFAPEGATGYNTDYSGFLAAYRAARGSRAPGRVALIGAGGVGRAIAFALLELGASALRLFDVDARQAGELAEALRAAGSPCVVEVVAGVGGAVPEADGIVNCTPIGMVGHAGSPVPSALLGPQSWVFDAVYTPVETAFLLAARRAGLSVISGYELFFYQGIDAFRLFTGRVPDDFGAVRRWLAAPPG